MLFKGFVERDDNFTTVYDLQGGRLITVARSTGEWAAVPVGGWLACGAQLTQELLEAWSAGLPFDTVSAE